jgi:hypothetical protein
VLTCGGGGVRITLCSSPATAVFLAAQTEMLCCYTSLALFFLLFSLGPLTPPPQPHPPRSKVIIGTHGKLRDWMQKRVLDVRAIRILVFDEADEMLKVGRCEGSLCFIAAGQSMVIGWDRN